MPRRRNRNATRVVAEQALDLLNTEQKVRARLYEPVLEADGYTWSCRFEIDGRSSGLEQAYGATSLQALLLGLKLLSITLYASHVYRWRELGLNGQFGGDLGVPAVEAFLDDAPYPF
jgi:hypothetical protein